MNRGLVPSFIEMVFHENCAMREFTLCKRPEKKFELKVWEIKVVIITLSLLGQKSCGDGTWKMFCHLRSSCCITHYGKHGWLWKCCFSHWWFSEVKNCNLGLKTAQNYRGWSSYLHCVPGRPLTFCLGDSALHKDIEVFSALDAKTILMCQHVFACLFSGWLIFEFSIEILFF